MRRSLLLYLLVFVVLIVVYQYVSASKMIESKDEQIDRLEQKLTELKEEQAVLTSENASLTSFSLAGNDDALSYWENRGYEPSEVAQLVEDQIISRNRASEDNELVPFEGMEGFMRINKIKILNHKWIIASFTDGTYWGEVFITYDIDENNNLRLETENSLLYPRS